MTEDGDLKEPLGQCDYPPCLEPAVAVLMRPFTNDMPVALCREHHERGLRLKATVEGQHNGHRQ
jgi:hypothetical protein